MCYCHTHTGKLYGLWFLTPVYCVIGDFAKFDKFYIYNPYCVLLLA